LLMVLENFGLLKNLVSVFFLISFQNIFKPKNGVFGTKIDKYGVRNRTETPYFQKFVACI